MTRRALQESYKRARATVRRINSTIGYELNPRPIPLIIKSGDNEGFDAIYIGVA